MSLDDLNREQRRLLRRQGALDDKGAPVRAPRENTDHQRVGPAQYLREVRDEIRKVAWPTKPEIIRYAIIVTVTVVVFTAFIGGLDYAMSFIMKWFYS
ncbi:MAG: preprotein translocase subunit SecE [Ilumatobacter coccineus]|uniref:Protein translocase subunit SecE n=1 Tax=Ilumatobacter coccineus TaxID=467094 RepID=A0A2G6K894_9ACTN|nr:MAG: preprotein translocase subunit SecE [Ilumatobacter coccineus]